LQIYVVFNGLKNNALITNISAPFKEEEEEETLFGVEVPNPFEYYNIFHDDEDIPIMFLTI